MYMCEYKYKCFCIKVFKLNFEFWAKPSRTKIFFDWRELLWSITVHQCVYANKHTCLALITSCFSSYRFHLSVCHSSHPTTLWRKMLSTEPSQQRLGLCHSPAECYLWHCCSVQFQSWSLLLISNGTHYPQWRKEDIVHRFLLVLQRINLSQNVHGDHIQKH